MESLDYKSLHESLTSNNNGSTPLESVLVILPCTVGIHLTTELRSFWGIPATAGGALRLSVFLIEFLCFIMPCILSFTVLADNVLYLLLTMFVSCCLAFYAKIVSMKKRLWLSVRDMFHRKLVKQLMKSELPVKRRPYITNFRACTNFLTVLSILAVDFHIFPRRFAKTETFGFGLMDLGVGLFMVANALVAPETRTSSQVRISIVRSLKHCVPLILLGSLRIVMTNLSGYQEHVTEYGQHWNFFFTLVVTKAVSSFLLKFIKHSTRMYILFSFSLIVMYEVVLYQGLQEWILSNAPRLEFMSANREGLASNVGYIALYFGGIALGRVLNEWDKLNGASILFIIKRLISISLIFWVITLLCEHSVGVSRRLANMGYFFWILSFSTTFIVVLLTFDLFTLYLKTLCHKDEQSKIMFVPDLSEAINMNGLLYFLLGNVVTGVINLSIKTFLLGSAASLYVIVLYMFVNCYIVTLLHWKRIVIKI